MNTLTATLVKCSLQYLSDCAPNTNSPCSEYRHVQLREKVTESFGSSLETSNMGQALGEDGRRGQERTGGGDRRGQEGAGEDGRRGQERMGGGDRRGWEEGTGGDRRGWEEGTGGNGRRGQEEGILKHVHY